MGGKAKLSGGRGASSPIVLIIFLVVLGIGGASELMGGSDSPRTSPETHTPPADSDESLSEGAALSSSSNSPKKPSAKKRKGKALKPPAYREKVSRGPSVLVSRVVDGDTIKVILNGSEESVRLIGIDTPETVHPSEPVECFGRASSDYTTSRLEGRFVTLEFDVERFDRYDRLLAYVWVGKQLFNRQMVAEGYAQVYTYPPNVRYTDRFLNAQREARRNDRGLWSACPAGGGAAAVVDTGSSSAGSSDGGCGYDPCLPPASDYDCAGGDGNGPKYVEGPVKVTGSDPYELDSDGDGLGCED